MSFIFGAIATPHEFYIGATATPLKSPCDQRERGRKRRRGESRGGAVASVRAKRVCEHSERSERQGDVEGESRGGAERKRHRTEYIFITLGLGIRTRFFIYSQLLFISFFNLPAFFVGDRLSCGLGINIFLSYFLFYFPFLVLSSFLFFISSFIFNPFLVLSSFLFFLSYFLSYFPFLMHSSFFFFLFLFQRSSRLFPQGQAVFRSWS